MTPRSHHEKNHRIQRGFTLFELLIVIAGIAVLSGVAFIQALNYLPTLRGNSAMNQVIQQMRVARNTAISDRRAIIVNISAAAGTIQLQRVPPGGGVPVTLSTVPVTGAQFCLIPGLPDTPQGFGNTQAVSFVNATSPGTPLIVTEFLSDGTFGQSVGVPANGTIFICVPGKTESARAVTVLGTTGRVRPYRWTSASWQE